MGGAVLVVPSAAEIGVGDSVLATAKRLSFITSCFPNAGSVFKWDSQRPELVRITPVSDSAAFVTGLGPGTFLVIATLEGAEPLGPLSAIMGMTIR